MITAMSIGTAHAVFRSALKLSRLARRDRREDRARRSSDRLELPGPTSGSITCPSTAAPRRLSGGEAQRIRLASQIGSGLVGVMYILDEPSIGLHQRDNERLLEYARCTCVTSATPSSSSNMTRKPFVPRDHVVDLGPGAGVHGGRVVVAGHAGRQFSRTRNP